MVGASESRGSLLGHKTVLNWLQADGYDSGRTDGDLIVRVTVVMDGGFGDGMRDGEVLVE